MNIFHTRGPVFTRSKATLETEPQRKLHKRQKKLRKNCGSSDTTPKDINAIDNDRSSSRTQRRFDCHRPMFLFRIVPRLPSIFAPAFRPTTQKTSLGDAGFNDS